MEASSYKLDVSLTGMKKSFFFGCALHFLFTVVDFSGKKAVHYYWLEHTGPPDYPKFGESDCCQRYSLKMEKRQLSDISYQEMRQLRRHKHWRRDCLLPIRIL